MNSMLINENAGRLLAQVTWLGDWCAMLHHRRTLTDIDRVNRHLSRGWACVDLRGGQYEPFRFVLENRSKVFGGAAKQINKLVLKGASLIGVTLDPDGDKTPAISFDEARRIMLRLFLPKGSNAVQLSGGVHKKGMSPNEKLTDHRPE